MFSPTPKKQKHDGKNKSFGSSFYNSLNQIRKNLELAIKQSQNKQTVKDDADYFGDQIASHIRKFSTLKIQNVQAESLGVIPKHLTCSSSTSSATETVTETSNSAEELSYTSISETGSLFRENF